MLQIMTMKQIPLEAISCTNYTFRISEELDSAPLADSIREVGLVNPLILFNLGDCCAIVCGFRRVNALKRLGRIEAAARVLPSDTFDPPRAFLMALWENIAHRSLTPLEKARALSGLKEVCRFPEERLVREYLPVLGLAPDEHVLRCHLRLNDLHPDLRRCVADGRLTQSSVEVLSEMPQSTQENFAAVMGRLRWSAAMQKKALRVLGELSAASGEAFDAPLCHRQVAAVLNDPGLSPFQKGEKEFDLLYRLESPRLSEAEARFAANRLELELPGSVRLIPHPYFEEEGLQVEFHASGIEHLRHLTKALQDAAQTAEMERLFDLD